MGCTLVLVLIAMLEEVTPRDKSDRQTHRNKTQTKRWKLGGWCGVRGEADVGSTCGRLWFVGCGRKSTSCNGKFKLQSPTLLWKSLDPLFAVGTSSITQRTDQLLPAAAC